MKKKHKIVFISDTHGKHGKLTLPDADFLVHCGDISKRGEADIIRDFNSWLKTLPHKYKIVIAGNHDFIFEESGDTARYYLKDAIYLEDSGIELEGIKFWGSPVTPRFFDWAFNRDRGDDIRKHWQKIPEGTDILISHGPPAGILDKTLFGKHVGCADLLEELSRIKPKVVAFGHIHESYGVLEKDGITFINASSLTKSYRVANQPVLIEF